MFAGIILILSFFNYESPRFLIKKGQEEHAVNNLAKLRGLPSDHSIVVTEMNDIKLKFQEEQEAYLGQGIYGYIREIFFVPSNLYRFYLGLGSQVLSQWSGAGSITLYAPNMFALLGTKGQNAK